jgi:hypothetical protein
LLGGCAGSSEPAQACTLIGCESGLEVELHATPGGGFEVEALAPGDTAPRRFECDPAVQCGGRAFFSGFTPESVTIRVLTETDTLVRSLAPVYDTLQPNGPGCPPTCRRATVRIARDTISGR